MNEVAYPPCELCGFPVVPETGFPSPSAFERRILFYHLERFCLSGYGGVARIDTREYARGVDGSVKPCVTLDDLSSYEPED